MPTRAQIVRDAVVAYNVMHRGRTEEQATAALDALLSSVHVKAGSLPEALWRERFCRPADSRTFAAALVTAEG